ncbi:MAG: hypothetical protein AAGG11_00590 [Pseudomonadota bacterium]
MKTIPTLSALLLVIAAGTASSDPSTNPYHDWQSIFDPVITQPVEPVEGEPEIIEEPADSSAPIVKDEPRRRNHLYPDRGRCAYSSECGPDLLPIKLPKPGLEGDYGDKPKEAYLPSPYPTLFEDQLDERGDLEYRIGLGDRRASSGEQTFKRLGARWKSRIPHLRYNDEDESR